MAGFTCNVSGPSLFVCYYSTVLILILYQGDIIFLANVGDSRAVLGTTSDNGNMVAVQLTMDFKPNLPRESLIHKMRVICMH